MYLAHDRCFHLYYVFGIWSMACYKTAFNITIHRMKLITYILYIEPYHVHIAYKIYAFIGVWVGYDQCCVCWWSDDRLHSPMGRLSTEFVFYTMEPVYSDHNFFVVPKTGGLSWQVLFVSWALLSTYRMICGTIHAAYINYGQCHVCRCRVQRLHPAMGRHGIVLMLASRALLSTCSIIHVAYIERVNTVPADVWCRLHSSHGQTRHSTCTCKLSFTIYMAWADTA